MILIYERKLFVLSVILLIMGYLKLVHSTLNIKDVCTLSKERYPDKAHTVDDILHTYELCLETVSQYAGEAKESLLHQLINRVGCFKEDLKQQYYAGNVRYKDVERVENMETELQQKGIVGNVHPAKSNCNYARMARSTVKHIIPLVVTGTLSEKKKACEALFKHVKGKNSTKVDIPTPQLDNDKDPKELTLPLTSPSTYKVDSPEAAHALTQYYKVVMKCLTLTTEHKVQVFRFNKKFYEWLTQAVLPHLKDEKCYPAFGGVLRIVETMRQNDFVPKNATANFIFYRQRGLEKSEEELREKEDTWRKIIHTPFFPLIVVPWVLFIIVILVICCWICGLCALLPLLPLLSLLPLHRKDVVTSSSSEVFYYPIEETPSVSIDIDDVSSEPPFTSHSGESRLKGGDDSPMYSMIYDQESRIIGLPLKRQRPSKSNMSSSSGPPVSPGKRKRFNVNQ